MRQLAWLPDAVRPGLFCAVILLLVAFIVRHNGLARIWHNTLRGCALLIDALVGLVLLPEFVVTTRRRARGQEPGSRVLAVSRRAEGVLAFAGGLYERHPPAPRGWTRLPWRTAVLIVLIGVTAWMLMVHTPATGGASRGLTRVFDGWRDVEAWAGVPADRAAAPGPGIRDADTAEHYVQLPSRKRLSFDESGTVSLGLGRAEHAAGAVVVIRNAAGASVGSQSLDLTAGEENAAKVHIAPPTRRRVNREKRLPVIVTVRIMDEDGTRAAVTGNFRLVNGAR